MPTKEQREAKMSEDRAFVYLLLGLMQWSQLSEDKQTAIADWANGLLSALQAVTKGGVK